MTPKVKKLIEQELYRRASIQVQVRRIALAESLIVEDGPKDEKIKERLRAMIDTATEAEKEGNRQKMSVIMNRVNRIAKQNKINLDDLSKDPAGRDSDERVRTDSPKNPNAEPDEIGDKSDSENLKKRAGQAQTHKAFGSDDKPDFKKKAGQAQDRKKFSDDEDDSDDSGADDDIDSDETDDREAGGVAPRNDDADDSETAIGGVAPPSEPMPKDGSADDDIKNGKVTYSTAGKGGVEDTKAIPQAWFEKWLEREKHPPAELKMKLSQTQHTARELTPPNTRDRDRINHFRETQAGYQNKIKAIQNVLRDLQKHHNKDIDTHNKKQDRRKEHINNLVDTLSGGNPLLKTIVGLFADKLLKNKDRVDYTGDTDRGADWED